VRVLHVIPSVNPSVGGPAEGLRQLCTVYRDGGHEVEVASLDAPLDVESWSFPAIVHGLGPGLGVFGFTTKAVPWLQSNLRRFDVAILNTIWQYSTLAAYRAIKARGIPYAVFTHGMLDPYFKERYPFKHVKKTLYWHGFLQKILSGASAVFFTSEEERILARRSFGNYKVAEVVVPYGTLGSSCDSTLASEAFWSGWPSLKGKRLALSLGRIHPKKGTDILIKAFAETLSKDPRWHLVIAGPDQVGWRKHLETLAEDLGVTDRITWTGMLTGAMKWGAYAASELFVLPSHQENFGLVVAEALSCGVPVVISNRINIWREIEERGAGIVSGDSLDGTNASLRRWMQLEEREIADYRTRSRRCYEEQFDLRVTSRRYLDAIERLSKPALTHAAPHPAETTASVDARELGSDGSPLRRVLLLHTRGFGDAVIGTSLAETVRSGLPSGKIDILTRPAMRSIFENHPSVDRVHTGILPTGYISQFGMKELFRLPKLVFDLRREGYTDVVNLAGDFREEMFGRIVSHGRNWSPRWTADHPCSKINRRSPFPLANRPIVIDSERMNAHECARVVGLAVGGRRGQRPSLYDASLERIVWKPFDRSIGIHPTASHKYKMWDAQMWQEVAGGLLRAGWDVYIFGSAEETPILNSILTSLDGNRLRVVSGDLQKFFDQLSRMRALLCHDSFAAHAAYAIGVPTILLNGGNDARTWAPPGATVLGRGPGMPCYPCHNMPTCIGSGHELDCLKKIPVESVIATALNVANGELGVGGRGDSGGALDRESDFQSTACRLPLLCENVVRES
jgi:glycosyltransferase involved in cell wall biosynthesis/ADP-heptose:LPS heptosyltransferase